MKIEFVEIEKTSIQSYGGKTFDLEVEEDHSYNVEGVIVHNSACLTAPNTGFGSRGWQLSAVAQVSEALDASHPHVKIIADGGIRTYGDIAKSIAFGADMVMIGGMLSGHDENPGEVLEMNGERKKAFFGSASEHQKGEHKHVEGQRLYMPYKGSLATTLQIIKENLQSSVSYAGGKDLHELRRSGYVKLK